jgi:hypothetical protein
MTPKAVSERSAIFRNARRSEQREPTVLLQLLDGNAQRRRGHVYALSGAIEVKFLSNGEEISNETKFKIHTKEAAVQTSVRLFFRRQIVRTVVVGKGFDCKLR